MTIPLYGCTTFWFIQSSADERSGCFHSLAIVNHAALNIHVQVFGWIYIFDSLGYLGAGLLSHVVKYLTFWGLPIGVPKQLHHFTFSTGGFQIFLLKDHRDSIYSWKIPQWFLLFHSFRSTLWEKFCLWASISVHPLHTSWFTSIWVWGYIFLSSQVQSQYLESTAIHSPPAQRYTNTSQAPKRAHFSPCNLARLSEAIRGVFFFPLL